MDNELKHWKQSVQVAIGKRIASERNKADFSLGDLAYAVDLSKGNLSDIENGKRDPRLSTLVRIANSLEIPLSELLKNLKLPPMPNQ